jgi:hypothetical protein
MTRGKIYTMATGLFYGLLALLISLLAQWLPGGPCGPNAATSFILLTPLFAVVGLLFSFIGQWTGHPSFKGPTVINGSVLLLCLLAYFFLLR